MAIPDHPWVDSADGAAVEIAMTIAKKGKSPGRLLTVVSEESTNDLEIEVSFLERNEIIHADLTIGAAITSVEALQIMQFLKM